MTITGSSHTGAQTTSRMDDGGLVSGHGFRIDLSGAVDNLFFALMMWLLEENCANFVLRWDKPICRF